MTVGVSGRDKEIDHALDETLVVVGERRACQALLEAIGEIAAAEFVLQRPIAVVIENGHGGLAIPPDYRPSLMTNRRSDNAIAGRRCYGPVVTGPGLFCHVPTI